MKTLYSLTCALLLPAAIWGATIDFESVALGTHSSLNLGDVTITYTGGNGNFEVVDATPGPPISGHALLSYIQNPGSAPFRADINIGGIDYFQIGVGDYNDDIDNTYLEVYDSSGNLLGSDYYQNPDTTYGGSYLSVYTAGTPIAYALFWDEEPFAGAVYWDNLTYGQRQGGEVPEPGTMGLAASALAAVALLRKLRRN